MGRTKLEGTYYERVYKKKLEEKKVAKEVKETEKAQMPVTLSDKKSLSIIEKQREEARTLFDKPVITKEEANKKYSLARSREEQIKEYKEAHPDPITIAYGYDPSTALEVRNESMIESALGAIFGAKDGSYFVHGQSTTILNEKRYKTLLIEDSNGFKYRIWFDITSMGYFSGVKKYLL